MILVYNIDMMDSEPATKLMNVLNRLGEPWRQLGIGDLELMVDDLLHDGQGQLNKGPVDAPEVTFVLIDSHEKVLDDFLAELRQEKIKLPYKAVLTETNRFWTLHELVKHVVDEEREVKAIMQLQRLMQAASMFQEKDYDDDLWQIHEEAKATAEDFLARVACEEKVTPDEAEDALNRFNQSVLILLGKDPE